MSDALCNARGLKAMAGLVADLSDYEHFYGMSSENMRQAIASGKCKFTQDLHHWVFEYREFEYWTSHSGDWEYEQNRPT